jgi:hypothetical protein
MKLSAITINDILAIHRAELMIDRPVLFVGAENGKGKSSLCEILRHAITSTSTRVSLKKEFRDLIHDKTGAKAGNAVIEWEGGKASLALPSGAQAFEYPGLTMGDALVVNATLPYLLDPARFGAITPDARREFLYTLMRVDATPASVLDRLKARKCDPEKSEEAAPLVINGFEFAAKEAAAKAREAKGAWKAVTNETYGSVKAATWAAEKPEFDAALIESATASIEALDNAISTASEALGEMTSSANRARQQAERITELLETVGKFERITEKLTRDRAELATWEAKVAETKAKATGAAPITPDTCPHCGGLVEKADGKLVAHQKPKAPRDPEAVAALPKYQSALDTMQRSVDASVRDLAAVESARAALAEIEQSAEKGASADEIAAARGAIEQFRTDRRAAQAKLTAAQEAQRKANAADEATGKAAHHHLDVSEWDAIATALSPSGIPGELLASAIEPVNMSSANLPAGKRRRSRPTCGSATAAGTMRCVPKASSSAPT